MWKSNTCQDHNSYIGSDQQDLTAQSIPCLQLALAGTEGRVKQAVLIHCTGGNGIGEFILFYLFQGKKNKHDRKASKYVNSGVW